MDGSLCSQISQRSSDCLDEAESLIAAAFPEVVEEVGGQTEEILYIRLDPLDRTDKFLIWANWHNLDPPSVSLGINSRFGGCSRTPAPA